MRALHGARSGRAVRGLAALVAGVVLMSGTGQAWAQAKKLPTAKEVIEKSIEAQGGKAAMEKLRSRVSKGTFEIAGQGIKGPVTAYEAAPNKQYVLIELEGLGRIESGTDGEVHWECSAMMGPRVLEGDEKALNARQTTFNAALYWQKLYKKAECVAVEEVDGQPCYKVVFTPKEGAPEVVYYSRKTHLPIEQEFIYKGPMGEIPVTVTPTDFKKVDGVLIPHKVTQDAGGVQTTVFTMTSIEHNVDMPSDRFALPESIKAIVAKAKADKKPERKDPAGEKE